MTALDKGKRKAVPEKHEPSESDSSSSSASSSDSDSTSVESDSEDEIITPEYLESLLDRARKNAAASRITRQHDNGEHEEDVIKLPRSKAYVLACLIYLIYSPDLSTGHCLR
jgi:hypothetical protein